MVSVDKRVHDDGGNLITVLHTLYSSDRDFKREVNLALKAAFGEEFDELIFPPAADQYVQLRMRWKSLHREQSAADLPDGAKRFLFLLAVLPNANRPSLIAIDELETGLHPSMMPIVAEYAAEATTRSQLVLATHSPALLDALGKHNPTVTVTEWQQGKTHLKVLSGHELQYWLKQFTLGEIYCSGQLEAMG